MAVFLWIVTTAVSLLLLYLVVKSAINNSVMADLHHEMRQSTDAQLRNAKAIEALSEEMKQIRGLLEESARDPDRNV
ncbi:hypothetical protein GE107_18775 [Cohnella sp. CFH 77786]|uniref:hypothetical protein n=1 Tax=Cohnella sp. CFH 77786 TaxID=2662265 RepID=UPI001C60E1AC|nr:hypothetical protein [Cohnella sp. CFH 77786]MBW5448105.1 hypothetical protein [Cohnella sp. CFH 77786]